MIMTEGKPSETSQKLFIVGLPRSATSTLVHSLRMIGFRGFAEGHFLSLLPAWEEAIMRYYDTWQDEILPDTMLSKMGSGELLLRCRKFFRGIFEELTGPPPWFDKNALPTIIPYLKLIQSVWPDASFIFMRRRPVDFIVSAMKKFPDRDFEHFCDVINFTFTNWEIQKNFLKKYIEVDQADFFEPHKLADTLIDFLKLDPKYRAPLMEGLRFQVERTSESYAPQNLDDLHLTPQQLHLFHQKCGPIMEKYP
jgi:hypothetical protein